MKCYEYCQALFDEVFLPVLRERFPEILPRLSVGVIGQGSDVLGADDELSRDHDWGPSKCQLLLPDPDVKQYGPSIAQALQAAVPDGFRGISLPETQPNTIRVSTIDTVYRGICQFAYPPETAEEWSDADDNALYFASSGFVLYDPSGALKKRISAFRAAYYPTDIWKWEIAGQLWSTWHEGDYNVCRRLTKRGDGIGLLIGQGVFVHATMHLLCLLNRRFPVYWKWLHWQFQQLPQWTNALKPHLTELESASHHDRRGEIIGAMCQVIREILHEVDLLPDTEWRNFMGSIDIIKQQEKNTMLKSYFIIAWRNLFRQRVYSLINIVGLAVGMACSLLIALYIQDELGYDSFHEKADRIYRVIREDRDVSGSQFGTPASGPLAEALRNNYPQVEKVVRLTGADDFPEFWSDYWPTWLRRGENVLPVRLCMADPAILKVFTLPLLRGDPAMALHEPRSALITRQMAQKLFGNTDPLDEVITIERDGEYRITGVLADIPDNSRLQFDLLTPFPESPQYWDQWFPGGGGWRPLEFFVLLKEGHTPEELERHFPDLIARYMGVETASSVSFHLQPFHRIHLYADYGLQGQGNITYIYLYALTACLILGLASINYVNLATARSMGRATEVGMRKTIGATRRQLIAQFLGESLLTAFLATLLAGTLVDIALPWFNTFAGKDLSLLTDGAFPAMFGLAGMGMVVGVLAGLYPAFYLSAVQPAQLKAVKGGGKRLRTLLVAFQFFVSTALIVVTGVVYQQMQFLQHKDWGYNKEEVVVLPIFQADPAEMWSEEWIGSKWWRTVEEFERHPAVLAASASHLNPPWSVPTKIKLKGDETPRNVQSLTVDENFLDAYEIELVAGRNFRGSGNAEDHWHSVIINEAAIENLGLENPIGQQVEWMATHKELTIIGVVADFPNRLVQRSTAPMVLFLLGRPPAQMGQPAQQLSVRINADRKQEVLAFFRATWQRLVPERPFYSAFADMHLEDTYLREIRFGKMCTAFTLLSILMVCMGCFGLAAFTVKQRTKEIGIRKVMGAPVSSIVGLLSREFVVLALVANLFSWPVAYYVAQKWLQVFAYRVEIGWGIFALGGILTLGIVLIAVSIQAVKAALENPVDALRYE